MNPKKERAKLAITNVSRVSQGRFLSNSMESHATCIENETITKDLNDFATYMRRNGLAETTIQSRIQALKQLARTTNLIDTEQVKENIISQKWTSLSKRRYLETYAALLRYLGLKWTKPRITIEARIPFIPTETEIDLLIASCGNRMATLLQTLKETGARISEIRKLKWIDLSTEQKTLNITPSKNSNPRLLRISDKLINMMNKLPRTRQNLFAQATNGLRTAYDTQRKTAAQKLQNPRIQKITFHTFRHWKATMEYHKTKDIIHVKTMLGHKSITSTMTYINIEQSLFLEQTDQWTSKVAQNTTQACQLIDAGFEYVTGEYNDGGKLFRKRK
jgi:integrase